MNPKSFCLTFWVHFIMTHPLVVEKGVVTCSLWRLASLLNNGRGSVGVGGDDDVDAVEGHIAGQTGRIDVLHADDFGIGEALDDICDDFDGGCADDHSHQVVGGIVIGGLDAARSVGGAIVPRFVEPDCSHDGVFPTDGHVSVLSIDKLNR